MKGCDLGELRSAPPGSVESPLPGLPFGAGRLLMGSDRPGIFVAVSSTGSDNRVMTSP